MNRRNNQFLFPVNQVDQVVNADLAPRSNLPFAPKGQLTSEQVHIIKEITPLPSNFHIVTKYNPSNGGSAHPFSRCVTDALIYTAYGMYCRDAPRVIDLYSKYMQISKVH